MFQKRLDYAFKDYKYCTLHSEHIWEDLQYVSNYKINKHALVITITESKKVQISIRILQTFDHRFGNATQVSLLKSNRDKLENMTDEPKNL